MELVGGADAQAGVVRARVAGAGSVRPKAGKYTIHSEDATPVRHMGDQVMVPRIRRTMSRNEADAILARREQYGSAAPRGLREQGMAGPIPPEDTAARGGPERPKIRDVGDGMVEIRGYHATTSPEGWEPKPGLHMGTQRAALHRMAGVEYGDEVAGVPGAIRSRYKPHGMFEVTVQAPREEVMGLRRPFPDDTANSLQMYQDNPSAGADRNPSMTGPRSQEAIRRVNDRSLSDVGYRNNWEDPGSLSHVVMDPGSISKVRRIYDAGTGAVGLMGLLGTAAQFIPGFAERMPRTNWLANGGLMGDLLNEVISGNYKPGGIMDPYRDYEGPRGPGGTILA